MVLSRVEGLGFRPFKGYLGMRVLDFSISRARMKKVQWKRCLVDDVLLPHSELDSRCPVSARPALGKALGFRVRGSGCCARLARQSWRPVSKMLKSRVKG